MPLPPPQTPAVEVPGIPQLVISAKRVPQDGFNLPLAIDRLDTGVISEAKPQVNLSEVLNRVPGIVVQNRQNCAQDLQISSRGVGARAAFGVRACGSLPMAQAPRRCCTPNCYGGIGRPASTPAWSTASEKVYVNEANTDAAAGYGAANVRAGFQQQFVTGATAINASANLCGSIT